LSILKATACTDQREEGLKEQDTLLPFLFSSVPLSLHQKLNLPLVKKRTLSEKE